MRTRPHFGTLLAAMLLAATPGAIAGPASLQGTFLYVPAKSDDVEAVIERAAGGLPGLVRGRARKQMRRFLRPYERMVLEVTSSRAEVTFDHNAPIRGGVDNQPVAWIRLVPNGSSEGEENEKDRAEKKKYTVRSAWENGEFRQRFETKGGKSLHRYVPQPDGKTLALYVSISGGEFGFNLAPQTYKLIYERSPR